MRAAVLDSKKNVNVREVALEALRADEVRIRVDTVGVCGSDTSEFAHAPLLAPLDTPHRVTGHQGPIILGHEFSGQVVEVGSEVRGVVVGESVVSGTSVSCWECEHCVAGTPNLCPDYWAVGLQRDGGLAEFCDIPAKICVPYDSERLTPDTAAMAQPLAIAIHSMRRGKPTDAERVAVIGAGGVGMFLVTALRSLTDVGLLVALEGNEARRSVAKAMGADLAEPDWTSDLGQFDLIYETSGTKGGLRTASEIAAPGGRIVLTGLQKPDETAGDFFRMVTLRELEVLGSMAAVVPTDFIDALSVLSEAHPWSLIAPRVHALEETPLLLAGADSAAIKILIDPSAQISRDAIHLVG